MNNYIKKNLGWWLFGILAIIPIARWFFILPINIRFYNLTTTTTSLGQILGLLGITLFALNLITGSKFKFVDRLFFGLPDALNFHSKTGVVAFCLILFHPIFLSIKYFQFSIKSVVMFFIPQGLDAISWGVYSLVLMILLMVLTFYIKLKYHTWLFSHKFMVLSFVFAIFHSFMIESDISRDLFLRYYIMGFSVIGLGLSLYNLILDKILNINLEYYVNRVDKLTDNINQIELRPKLNKNYNFIPGQFVFIKFKNNKLNSEFHPFSVSSTPLQKNLEFTIKALGDFTSQISNLKIGDIAFVKGPFGKFSFKEINNNNQIWISGGIGITPFLSMARSLVKDNRKKIDLYYCVKNKSELVLKEDLLNIEKEINNFKLIFWVSDDMGFITAEKIKELSCGLNNKDIFLCGPVSFMNSLKLQLIKIGVKNKNIYWEKFSF